MNNKPTYLSREMASRSSARSSTRWSTSVAAEVASRIHDAKEHGDLSENAEYEDAKNEQAFVEGRIQTLEALIKNATIIDEHHSTDHVQIGSTVEVESTDGKETFTIVGSAEATPRRRPHLERDRPVGRALLGKKKGEKVPWSRCRPATSSTRSSASPDAAQHMAAASRRSRRIRMDWADELAARRQRPAGRQRLQDAVRAPSTSAACAGRSSTTPSGARLARPTASRRRSCYGVEDIDPMDAQALLTPDAIDREMGRPLAHVPAPAGTASANYARHFAGLFIARRSPVSASTPSSTG